jgi:hypothetical protein
MTQANNVAIESSQINSSGVLQVAGGGTGVTTSTGTGALVLNSSPTFIGTTVIPTINSGTSTALTLQSNGTTAITVDTSQNVGIGTSSPSSKLSVVGIETLRTINDNGYISFFNSANSTRSGFIQGAVGTFTISADLAVPMTFQTAGTERMRIDSSGNLLVGNTGANIGVAIQPSAFGTGNANINVNHPSGVGGNSYIQFVYSTASIIGSITQNGTTGVLYNLTSDYRLKDNPVPLTGASEFIMALQPKSWDWWDGSGKGVGFIAHEFMEVAKHSGNGEKDAIDAQGKPVYQSIQPSSSEVMANLVSLVQEQQALITDLQTRLTKAGL